jgi:hypothetical protein
MRFYVILLAIFILFTPVSGLKIIEVYPNPFSYQDSSEFIRIYNEGNTTNLTNWILTDLEDEIHLVGIIGENSTIVIAKNGSAFFKTFGYWPDYEWTDVSDVLDVNGNLALSNSGDEILLLRPDGGVEDALIYGKTREIEGWKGEPITYFREGVILKRSFDGSFRDTDSASDWNNPRIFIEGQTNLKVMNFSLSNITILVFPSSNFSLPNAKESIYLAGYTIENEDLVNFLIDQAKMGVDVVVQLEGNPAGGIKKPDVLNNLASFTQVYVHDQCKVYRFFHNKYAIIDNKTLIILTENWKNTNRGYGVIINDTYMSAYFRSVYISDLNHAVPYSKESDVWESKATKPSQDRISEFPTISKKNFYSTAIITPIFSPDTSYYLLSVMKSANSRIYVEVPYIQMAPHMDSNTLNPFVEALISAAERGVDVKLLLDSSWYVTKKDTFDNDDIVRRLNNRSKEKGLNLEARLIHSEGFEKLHGKLIIVDNTSYIGSMNWNENSMKFNREAGLLIHNTEIADYLTERFLSDWETQKTHLSFLTSLSFFVALLFGILILKKRMKK